MSLVFQVNGEGRGWWRVCSFSQQICKCNTFLREGHHPFSVTVNMCVLSTKIQLVRLSRAVSVPHFLCCDCSEDGVAQPPWKAQMKSIPKIQQQKLIIMREQNVKQGNIVCKR